MRMKTKKVSTASFGTLFLIAAGIATAHPEHDSESSSPISFEPSIVGHISLEGGLNNVIEADGSPNDQATIPFSGLNASITLPTSNNFLMTVDGDIRWDEFSNADVFDDDEDPEWQFNVGLHVLKQFNDDSRSGAFFAYGDTKSQDQPREDEYNVLMGGLEVHHFLYDGLMVYTQLGYGQKVRDGASEEEGFSGGIVARSGATYFMSETSTINVDIEFANTYSYIDDNDPGRFFGATLAYEKQWVDSPIFMSLFGRMDHYSSTDEGDDIDEWQLGVGMKYYFGAGSQVEAARKGASIGTPRLPTRASAWTEYMD